MNPFKDFDSDLVVIIDSTQIDDQVTKVLTDPIFVEKTEILHFQLDPIMLGSMVRIQRSLTEYKQRILVIYLVDAWVHSDREEIGQLEEWISQGNVICLTRNVEKGTILALCYPSEANGVSIVKRELSNASLVALGCLTMSSWQQEESRESALNFLLDGEKTIEELLFKLI